MNGVIAYRNQVYSHVQSVLTKFSCHRSIQPLHAHAQFYRSTTLLPSRDFASQALLFSFFLNLRHCLRFTHLFGFYCLENYYKLDRKEKGEPGTEASLSAVPNQEGWLVGGCFCVLSIRAKAKRSCPRVEGFVMGGSICICTRVDKSKSVELLVTALD